MNNPALAASLYHFACITSPRQQQLAAFNLHMPQLFSRRADSHLQDIATQVKYQDE
jgi:hypothetical protein